MQVSLDCLPCQLRQILEAARMATNQTAIQEKIMENALQLSMDYKSFSDSADMGRALQQIIAKHTGVLDPYRKIKDKNIKKSLEVYPLLQRFTAKKDERLYWALKTAATGNIIDSAVYSDVSIEDSLMGELEKEFTICDIERLEEELKQAGSLLIIGDNAGETVFDRVLISQLEHLDITYAVRSEPMINDATLEDARASGLEDCSRLISTGCNVAGVILDECSEEFLDIFYGADIVICKGQGNYETLSEHKGRSMFFLLKAKCSVLAGLLGVSINDYIFKWNGVADEKLNKS
jgi:uncharacterized protein with ATP-grasp and redox domains